tara:strand:- start:2890 stop:4434 length:1545 start_codon:yes stop_codon:yes gene_type:complete
MARKLTEIPAVSAKRTEDPYLQPAFSLYSLHWNWGGGFYTYDHNFNLVHQHYGDGDGSYGEFRTYTTAARESLESVSSYEDVRTNEHPGSSYSYMCNSTYQNGYGGHQCFSSATATGTGGIEPGIMTLNADGSRYRRSYFNRDACTIPSSIHQDFGILADHGGGSGVQLSVGPRSMGWYYSQKFSGQSRGVNWCYVPLKSLNTSGYGTCSWNVKTNKFLHMECDGGGSWKPVIWSNCPDFRKYALEGNRVYAGKDEKYAAHSSQSHVLQDYFQTAANADSSTYETFSFQSSPQGYSNQSEAHYRGVMVLCDNDKIVMFTHHPGSGGTGGFSCVRWNASGQVETGGQSPSPNQHHQIHHPWTNNWTHYGYEQGQWLGIRWQMSSDGRYIWAYCPEYYWGGGAYWGCVRVSDGKVIFWNMSDSSHGYSFLPVGKSSLMVFQQWNTDGGQGAYHKMHDLEMWFSNWDDAYNWSSNVYNHYYSRYFEAGGAYSTSYYCAIPAHYDTSLFTKPQINEFE